ncbi:MAG: hypothetical protein JNK64_09320 [Myxococcales bacterium]|nr:hypothetical protein [Myxococcales bacterium]
MRTTLAVATLAIAACGRHPIDAARPGPAPTPLLGGRLTIRPPTVAAVAPRGHSVMAAPASAMEESRIVLVPGDGEYARFVLMATETFVTVAAPPPDGAALAAYLPAGATQGEVTLADGAVAIEFVGTAPAGDAPLLVYGALVPMPDHTLIELDYYVMPEDADDRAAWAAQARALTQTVRRGDRTLERAARTVTFEGLTLDAPADVVLTEQPGPDFAVYKLRALGALAAPAAMAGVYLGGWPAYQHAQADVADAAIAREAGTLLGEAVEWHRWRDGDVEVREAILARGDHAAIHVFRIAPAADPRAAALDAALATLRAAPTSTSR